MHFIVGSNINLRMQYSDSPTEDNHIVTERLAVRDNILKDFIYKAVYLLNKFDGLKAIEPYVNEISENIQIICDNHFKLTGMFIATTLRDLAARNKYALDIDFELEPPLFEISDTHYAATWLLHPNAPKVEMPKIIKERIERMTKGREE
jgi:hypothetical protein